MVDGRQRDDHVARTYSQVKHEEQKVAIVLKSNTIVDPRAVMVHQKATRATHFAVVRPSWLYLTAGLTLLSPEFFELLDGFTAVA